jgi:hypothetical protein
MNAEEFMRDHADKACAGRIPEIMGDLTPEAMQQIMPLVPEMPNPAQGNTVVSVAANDGDHVFDVTYTGDGKQLTMRETVREVDGKWRIVKLERPA